MPRCALPSSTFSQVFALLLSLAAGPLPAIEFTGHHGGVITHCQDPEFYRESPAPNSQINRLETLSFIASENTLPETVAVFVDLVPLTPSISKNGNGTFTVTATLPGPHAPGRAWVKVTALSEDGCQQLHNWNLFVTTSPP